MRRTIAAGLLVVLLTGGCGRAQEARSKAEDCAALAADATEARRDVSSVAGLERLAHRLDERIRSVGDSEVRAAAEQVRDGLRRLVTAMRSGDRAAIDRARQELHEAARRAAAACGYPVGSSRS